MTDLRLPPLSPPRDDPFPDAPDPSDDEGGPRRLTGGALTAVRDGRVRLGLGSEGPAIRALQHALIDLGYPLPRSRADGSYGAETSRAVARFQTDAELPVTGVVDGATLQALTDAAPPAGQAVEHFPEYDRLYADGRLEVTIAHGFYEEGAGTALATSIARVRQGLIGQGFELDPATGRYRRELPDEGGGSPVEVVVRLIVPDPARLPQAVRADFVRALERDEVVCYLGHARYGTGPDFDPIDSPRGNFVIDRDGGPTGHPHPPLTTALEDTPPSMLPEAGPPPSGYQLLYLQACTTQNYLPNLRDPALFRGRDVQNTDLVATSIPMRISTAPDHVLSFLEMLCARRSVDAFETEENAREAAFVRELRQAGLLEPDDVADEASLRHGIFDSGFLDNPSNRLRERR